MYGYVFLAKNLVTGDVWVGINRSVAFSKTFFGDKDEIIDAVNRYGITKFTVEMIAPAESEETLLALERAYKAKYESPKKVEEVEAPVKRKAIKKKKAESDE